MKTVSSALRRAFFVLTEAYKRIDDQSGSITLLTAIAGTTVVMAGFGTYLQMVVPKANADNVNTAVTVLNTAPTWTVDAQEQTQSSTSTPTLAGYTIAWIGTADDSSLDNYWMIICKNNATPTPNASAAPTCSGGMGNQWAVSPSTVSGQQATAATTTIETFPFNNEVNYWYAWICDGNVSLPRCNNFSKIGSGTTVSPFVIDHPPVFSAVSNDAPINPGGTVTWTTTATDTDLIRGGDTVKLYVCKARDFATSTCGAGGTWAVSSFFTFNPATSTTFLAPQQNKNYSAFAYITDQLNLSATSTFQAASTTFYIKNVAPTIAAASISLVDRDDSGDLSLVAPHATSSHFKVKFTVSDNNSCLNASSTNEISSIETMVYRSGITQAACKLSGDYNSNNCYPSASPFTDFICQQATSSPDNLCSGASDSDVDWRCTFSLWYNADPTDASTTFAAQNWLATVRATDWRGATTSLVESSSGNELDSFLAFTVSTTSIGYGGLQPGQQNDPLIATTDLLEYGNIGLDENLYGDTMCTNWTAPDSCDNKWGIPGTPTSTIFYDQQRFGSSSVPYANTFSYTLTGSTSPSLLTVRVPKTTATTSPNTRNTFWGVNVPATITLAGNYTGQNTIIATKSNFAFW